MRHSKLAGDRQATLAIVAAELGLSTATVSRALHKPHLLNPGTVERVRTMVDRVGYRPNFLAQNLKTGRTYSILVVVPVLTPSFLEVLRGVQQAAEKAGYFAAIACSGYDARREDQYFDQVSSGRADGVLLLSGASAGEARTSRYRLPPVVSALDADPAGLFPSIQVDHKTGAGAAVNHLIGLGHRRIAHIAGNPASRIARQRREGFLSAMAAAGLAIDASAITEDFTPEAGASAMERLLSSPQPPTAVFAANDELAVGAVGQILKAGLSIPGDIAVIGFDNLLLGRACTPALTTVDVPMFDLGRLGMEKLLRVIGGESVVADEVLPTVIIERSTTARLSS
jgi:LacI family repressor for deo operon, udp, cdd, tsx, nupC, and nupG